MSETTTTETSSPALSAPETSTPTPTAENPSFLGSQQPQSQEQDSTPAEKPEWLPEKFWRNDAPDVESLAKSYDGLEKLLGKKAQAVVPPNEKSTPEEVAAYRKAIGVPNDPSGYGLTRPDNLPEGVTWDDNVAKQVADIAHKHNIPASALQELMMFDLQRSADSTRAAAALIQETLTQGKQELQRVYGEKMPEKLGLAERVVATAKGNPKSWGFGDPEVVKVLAETGAMLSDDKLVEGGQATFSSAKARARDIQTNAANPLHQRYVDGDPEIVDQVRRMITSG